VRLTHSAHSNSRKNKYGFIALFLKSYGKITNRFPFLCLSY
jgi:hypothetical protein